MRRAMLERDQSNKLAMRRSANAPPTLEAILSSSASRMDRRRVMERRCVSSTKSQARRRSQIQCLWPIFRSGKRWVLEGVRGSEGSEIFAVVATYGVHGENLALITPRCRRIRCYPSHPLGVRDSLICQPLRVWRREGWALQRIVRSQNKWFVR